MSNKIRKPRARKNKSPFVFGQEYSAIKAASLIKKHAKSIGFILGTPWDKPVINGVIEMIKTVKETATIPGISRAIEYNIRFVKHDWTTIFAFLEEDEDGGVKLTLDYFYVKHVDTKQLDAYNRATIIEEWDKYRPNKPLGQIWVSIPVLLDKDTSPEEVIEGLDEFLETARCFDVDFMRERFNSVRIENISRAGLPELDLSGAKDIS